MNCLEGLLKVESINTILKTLNVACHIDRGEQIIRLLYT
jgi:hypothetical protein